MSDRQLPGPGSLCWGLLGQRRMLLVTGRALVMEAALPAGGAALARHSTYRTRPLRRLEVTLESLQRLTYGDPETREREFARIRRVHRHINGTDEGGRPYDGLDDASRTWIAMTLFDAMVAMERLAGRPLSPADEAQLYDEWRPIVVSFGIDTSAVPQDLADYHAYFASMLADVLEDNPEVRHLLGAVYASVPVPPWLAWCPAPLWKAVSALAATLMSSVLRADLPHAYSRRIGLTARRRDRILSWLVHRTARWVLAVQPVRGRFLPPAASALQGGSVAPRAARRRSHVPRQRPATRTERVGRFFDEVLDQTGDGLLTRADLQAMVRSVCWPLELDAQAEQRVYESFDAWWAELLALDTDGDGRISRAEFVAGTPSGTDETPQPLQAGLVRAMGAVFDAADSDHNGHLDKAEYRRIFGPKLHPADADRGFDALDSNGDGQITKAEFLDALGQFFTVRGDAEAAVRLFGRN
ncbi:EF-hand domain-containing protein [Streptomyces beijiangensis]|uniref:EF-hand domain-containing protein n=1 Tax=Streptomyces beijiangensis TaxID=163361 RepID=A0A939JHB5_9ACTN|nr:EF-hand domain-containing protein [Streptomyces beijiangensis]MBO0511369.1 EF-hand domain-containing protein [Streptomyces beijiangensis]